MSDKLLAAVKRVLDRVTITPNEGFFNIVLNPCFINVSLEDNDFYGALVNLMQVYTEAIRPMTEVEQAQWTGLGANIGALVEEMESGNREREATRSDYD